MAYEENTGDLSAFFQRGDVIGFDPRCPRLRNRQRRSSLRSSIEDRPPPEGPLLLAVELQDRIDAGLVVEAERVDGVSDRSPRRRDSRARPGMKPCADGNLPGGGR